MSTLPPAATHGAGTDAVLPTDDESLLSPDLDLPTLASRWAAYAARRPMTVTI